MPRPKKPAKIIPDNLNMALRVQVAIELRPKNAGAFVLMPKEAAGLVGGILSLVAERDAAKESLKGAAKHLDKMTMLAEEEWPTTLYEQYGISAARAFCESVGQAPGISCDFCVPKGFPNGAVCPKCGRITLHVKVPE